MSLVTLTPVEMQRGRGREHPTPPSRLTGSFQKPLCERQIGSDFHLREPGMFVRWRMALEGTRTGVRQQVEAGEGMGQERAEPRCHEYTNQRMDWESQRRIREKR